MTFPLPQTPPVSERLVALPVGGFINSADQSSYTFNGVNLSGFPKAKRRAAVFLISAYVAAGTEAVNSISLNGAATMFGGNPLSSTPRLMAYKELPDADSVNVSVAFSGVMSVFGGYLWLLYNYKSPVPTFEHRPGDTGISSLIYSLDVPDRGLALFTGIHGTNSSLTVSGGADLYQQNVGTLRFQAGRITDNYGAGKVVSVSSGSAITRAGCGYSFR